MVQNQYGERLSFTFPGMLAIISLCMGIVISTGGVVGLFVKVDDWIWESGVASEKRHEETLGFQKSILEMQATMLEMQKRMSAQEDRTAAMADTMAQHEGLRLPPQTPPKTLHR